MKSDLFAFETSWLPFLGVVAGWGLGWVDGGRFWLDAGQYELVNLARGVSRTERGNSDGTSCDVLAHVHCPRGTLFAGA